MPYCEERSFKQVLRFVFALKKVYCLTLCQLRLEEKLATGHSYKDITDLIKNEKANLQASLRYRVFRKVI